jgi:KipI family sensor histidine kinase inhibitor
LHKHQITYHAYSEKALLISWEEQTPDMISKRTTAERQIKKLFKEEVYINHGAYSLLVVSELEMDHRKLIELIDKGLHSKKLIEPATYLWKLPVFYDIEKGLTKALESSYDFKEIISIHSSSSYVVDFIGFLPGFPYLKGLDSRLQLPRKTTPSLKVAAGSVAISNEYCGIYPASSPGGWHVLGNCPLPIFDVHRSIPSLLQSGDQVEFYAVSKEEYDQLITQRETGILALENFKSHV